MIFLHHISKATVEPGGTLDKLYVFRGSRPRLTDYEVNFDSAESRIG